MDTIDIQSISIILFQEYYINRTMQYVIFWDWLSSHSITPWGFIQVVACIHSLFLFIAE